MLLFIPSFSSPVHCAAFHNRIHICGDFQTHFSGLRRKTSNHKRSEKRDVYRAAVHQWLDEGIIVVGQLLIVGAQEAQRLVVVVGFGVIPGRRLMTDVGEVLPCRRAQQLQEGHLD